MGYLIVYLALTAFSIGWPEYLNTVGNDYNNQLNNVVKDIYHKMQKNNTFYENILNAYNDKKSDLLSSLLLSNGFGTRVSRLKQAMAENNQFFNKKKEEYDKNAANLSSELNRVQDIASKTGTLAGNKSAKDYLKDNKPIKPGGSIQDHTVLNINQAITGGLKENYA